MTHEYAAVPAEMRAVEAVLGKELLHFVMENVTYAVLKIRKYGGMKV